MKYIYLASPYSHPDPDVRSDRAAAAMAVAVDLMRAGLAVFSPIAHSHAIAMIHDLPGDWGFWEAQDIPLLHHAAELYVLTLDGWDSSRGVASEIAYARSLDKPITYISEWAASCEAAA